LATDENIMDKAGKNKIVFSEPVNDIMGAVPGRILRWGTAIILAVLALFIFFMWLVKYPDRIPAPVEITTVNPPVTLVSRISGRIKNLYVSDRDEVGEGDLLAVMETAASIDEINSLKSLAGTISDPGRLVPDSMPDFTELGELQSYWSSFLKSLSDFNNYNTFDFYGNKINSLTDEINAILAYIGRIKVKEKLYAENQMLETRKFRRDSLLFTEGVYSESELEKSRQALIRINIELQQVRLDHSQKSIELAEKRQLLQDYRIRRVEEGEKYFSVLNESFLNLKAQIKIWEKTYLLVSPVDGTVTLTKYWSENQTVGEDDPVLSVIPEETGDFIGRINLRMNRSGKVEPGQEVHIKLSGYPYLEYGMVRGVVKSLSLVPSGDSYIIEISLPEGLKTLYGKNLVFTQNMQGTAEIITEDLRLLQKILNPFRHLISRNRSRVASLSTVHNHP
jgi:HlyD family secretion protein